MCSFPQEIARHKTVSAHFLEESAATKLFRLISSGNRPHTYSLISSGNRWMGFHSFPQEIGRHKTFSAHFLRKSAATKLFRLISSGNRPPQNCFGSFPQEIGRSLTHSFPQEIAGWASTHFLRKSATHLLTHFLRKSLDGLPLISSGNRRMTYIELDVILTFLRRTHVSVDAHGKAPF